ncbi:MAG: DNA-binding GntR family transcriptional regulator [Gammaproteobacteria bacterium]|jgi:DNA-binding GntR family transcriptional regulator
MSEPEASYLQAAPSPQTLREIVQERLREAIIEGHFTPGQRLVERPLCDQLGVSRTVIRETIRYLEAEGLVEILPNKGPIVAPMSWEHAQQIYDIRLLLETSAAVDCAKKTSPELANHLNLALTELESAFADGKPKALFKATTRFYKVIFEEAGHLIAWETVQRLNGRISRLRVMTLSTTDRHVSGHSHMKVICDAIIKGDVKATRVAVETHLKDASSIAKRLLKASEKN